MELTATFLWYGCFVFVCWCPMRDTAAMQILTNDRKRRYSMYALLWAIPLIVTILAALSIAGSDLSDHAGRLATLRAQRRVNTTSAAAFKDQMELYATLFSADFDRAQNREGYDTTIEFVGVILLYLAMPLYLYFIRIRISYDLEKGGKRWCHKTEQLVDASNMISSAPTASAVDDKLRQDVEEMSMRAPAPLIEASSQLSTSGRIGVESMEVVDIEAAPTSSSATAPAPTASLVRAPSGAPSFAAAAAIAALTVDADWNPFGDRYRKKALEKSVSLLEKSAMQQHVAGFDGACCALKKEGSGFGLKKAVSAPTAALGLVRMLTENVSSANLAEGDDSKREYKPPKRLQPGRGGGGGGGGEDKRVSFAAPSAAFSFSRKMSQKISGGRSSGRRPSFVPRIPTFRGAAAKVSRIPSFGRGAAKISPYPPRLSSTKSRSSSGLVKISAEPTAEELLIAVARRAATQLQSRIRMRIAKRKYQLELQKRKDWLRCFHWPIFIFSIVDMIGANVMYELERRGSVHQNWLIFSLLFFTFPAFICIVIDQKKRVPPRFSLAHAIFLVSVLYRMATRAAYVDILIHQEASKLIASTEEIPSSLQEQSAELATMCGHFAIFLFVTAVGKMSLTLVSTNHASLHLLFPFQMFDFLFLYSFFTVRSVKYEVNWLTVLTQIALQVNIIGRNSGYTDAFVRRYLRYIVPCLLGEAQLRKSDPNDDPLFRLQSIARMSIQYDLADLTSIILTPSIITMFVWRDGWFTLEGSGILIESCELPQLWLRFLMLLCIKPVAAWLARHILITDMRKTLLGKATMHGTSAIAAGIIASKRIHKEKKERKAGETDFTEAEAAVQAKFGYSEDELMAVREDLTLTDINFRLLRAKQFRKWRFFTCVAILQAFAAFPVHVTAPVYDLPPLMQDEWGDLPLNSLRPSSWNASIGLDFLEKSMDFNYGPRFQVPRQSVWLYVDGNFGHLKTAIDLDGNRRGRDYTAFNADTPPEGVIAARCIAHGWRIDGGPWEYEMIPSSKIKDLNQAKFDLEREELMFNVGEVLR